MISKNNQVAFHTSAVVISGRGIASEKMKFINADYKIKDRFFLPGTLNLVTQQPIIFNREAAEIGKDPSIHLYSIYLDGYLCWVRRYPQCPSHILEVISEVNLRNTLQLNDGDEVHIEIANKTLSSIGFFNNILWNLTWKGREFWFYHFNWYPKLISKFLNLRHRFSNINHIKND